MNELFEFDSKTDRARSLMCFDCACPPPPLSCNFVSWPSRVFINAQAVGRQLEVKLWSTTTTKTANFSRLGWVPLLTPCTCCSRINPLPPQLCVCPKPNSSSSSNLVALKSERAHHEMRRICLWFARLLDSLPPQSNWFQRWVEQLQTYCVWLIGKWL